MLDPTNTSIRTRRLTIAHGDHVALDAVDLELPRAVTVACIGPNGSGKTSLLDAISGLLEPAAGSIEVFGARPGAARAAASGDAIAGRVAHVLQSTDTPAHLPLTVGEVVTMGRYARTGVLGRIGADGRAAVQRALERTDIVDLQDRQLLELSGGQRQRVLVAQGLAQEADLLVLDEPMTGLDVVSRERILEVMNAERDVGRTVIFSTHDMAEADAADLVVLLAGRVVAVGTPEHVLRSEHLLDAYRGKVIDMAGVMVVDDPHHHGDVSDRHDGHVHSGGDDTH